MCHMSRVRCHVLRVKCYMSHVRCHVWSCVVELLVEGLLSTWILFLNNIYFSMKNLPLQLCILTHYVSLYAFLLSPLHLSSFCLFADLDPPWLNRPWMLMVCMCFLSHCWKTIDYTYNTTFHREKPNFLWDQKFFGVLYLYLALNFPILSVYVHPGHFALVGMNCLLLCPCYTVL